MFDAFLGTNAHDIGDDGERRRAAARMLSRTKLRIFAALAAVMPPTLLATSEQPPVEPVRSEITQKLVLENDFTYNDGPLQLSVPKRSSNSTPKKKRSRTRKTKIKAQAQRQ